MDLTEARPVHDGDVSYEPWTDGRAVGFRVQKDGHPDEYLLLNPSDRDGDETDVPNVFLYWGSHGDVARDASITYLPVMTGAVQEIER